MTTDVRIRQNVIAHLRNRGWSNREFARQLGVSHNWVHRHLRSDEAAPFSVADVELMARTLGVPLASLIPADPAPPPTASEYAEMDPDRCAADWEEVGTL